MPAVHIDIGNGKALCKARGHVLWLTTDAIPDGAWMCKRCHAALIRLVGKVCCAKTQVELMAAQNAVREAFDGSNS